MPLTPNEQRTVDAYNKHANVWINEHNDDDFYKEEYIVLQSLAPKGKVLEIGVGAGTDAEKLMQMGYDYIGTDVAENLLKAAQLRVPNAKLFVSDIYSLNFNEQFDVIWCAAVLLHIPKERINEALSAIANQLKAGGICFISTKQGDRNDTEPLPYDPDAIRVQAHYSKEEFDALVTSHGFEIASYNFRPLSERAKWMCYFLRKI